MLFSPVHAHRQMTPESAPSTIAPIGPTKPHAGVIATRPATAPVAAPSMLGLPFTSHSANIQPRTAAAVANCVLMRTSPTMPSTASSLPTLKPNQPTHSSEAPIIVKARLWGGMASLP